MKIRNIPKGIFRRIQRYFMYPILFFLFDSKWRKIKVKVKRIGNRYGGGYIVPDLMNSESLVYSFGLGEDISFDMDLISLYNCKIIGFDPTPKSVKFISELNNNLSKKFSFMQFGLSSKSGKKRLYLPQNPEHVSGSLTKDLGGVFIECDFLSFEDIIKKFSDTFVDLVKMDIEGEEYNIFGNWLTNNYIPPIGQIWVEFHPKRSGYNNTQTTKFVKKFQKISLIPVKRAFLYNPNNYLLLNTKYYNR